MLQTILEWCGATTGRELGLVLFGVGAQALFFGRWIVQWLATERRGTPHVPPAFWWISLAGASMLLCYFVLRREPVGVLGQSVGWLIYVRNLVLERRVAAE